MIDEMSLENALFPDRLHFLIFCGYVTLFVNQGLLVTGSKQDDGTYGYSTILVVILTEFVKLLMAVGLYLNDYPSLRQLSRDIRQSLKIFFLYLIPAFLYCLYNNLAFMNLNYYDPTSYFILLNFRTVTTGIVFEFLFKRRLTCRQWIAMILLTVGCLLKQVRSKDLASFDIELNFHLVLMLIQVFCSCFAGVYNEYLLKFDSGADVHIMVQNIYMYVDSLLMNFLLFFFAADSGAAQEIFSFEMMKSIFTRPVVLAIILNNSVAGITTSIFLKYFNSILKTFAGAIELLLTAVLSYFLFGFKIDTFMLVSIAVVSWAMYLYSLQPVVNKPSIDSHRRLKKKQAEFMKGDYTLI